MTTTEPTKKSNKAKYIITGVVIVLCIFSGLGAWAFYTVTEAKKVEINKSNELFTTYDGYFTNSESLLKKTVATIAKGEETGSVLDTDYAELTKSSSDQSAQYNNLQDIAKGTNIEFGKKIADSSLLFSAELKKTEQNIKTDQCARTQFANFKKTQAEIDETETSLGKFIIILNNSTSSKLVTLSEKYKVLSTIVKNSAVCFTDSVTLSTETEKLFTTEAGIYEKIADISLRQSEVTNNVTEFNAIGKDRPSFFTVYFEKNVPIWLEKNSKNIESRLTKLQVDYTNMKQLHQNLTGKQQ